MSRAGIWGTRIDCLGFHYPVKFRIRVLPREQEQVTTDRSGLNNIEFTCDNGEILNGYGINVGEWGEYSEACDRGICGLATRVQADGGILVDDTTLNDVRFLCC